MSGYGTIEKINKKNEINICENKKVPDIIKRLDPWFIEHFYISLEDLLSFNMTESTFQAWAESFIDYENEQFSLMIKNETLPMEYYQQSFDEKYTQLMQNIANWLIWEFTGMMDMNDGNNNGTDSTMPMLLSRLAAKRPNRHQSAPKPAPNPAARRQRQGKPAAAAAPQRPARPNRLKRSAALAQMVLAALGNN